MNAPDRPINKRRARLNYEGGDIVILCAEEQIRDAIAYWLSSQPAKTIVAADGYHAARIVRSNCRWLVTDRVLPPWPGLDNFLDLRAAHPQLRIAFIDNGNPGDRILARVTGASVMLARPLTRRTVSDALALTSVT